MDVKIEIKKNLLINKNQKIQLKCKSNLFLKSMPSVFKKQKVRP